MNRKISRVAERYEMGGTVEEARLSYMGLPCPNLCTGGENFHGKYEFISIQSMETIVEILIKIAAV